MTKSRTWRDVGVEYTEMAVRLPGNQVDTVARRAFVDQLHDFGLTPELAINVMGYLRREPGRRFMPSAADVRRIAQGDKAIPHRARELAGNIAGAIGRIGYNDPPRARAMLGDDAWRCIVGMYGGWAALAQQWPAKLSEQSTLRAQMRDWIEQDLQFQLEKQARQGDFAPIIDMLPDNKKAQLAGEQKNHARIADYTRQVLGGQQAAHRPRAMAVQGHDTPRLFDARRHQQLDD